MDWRIKGPVRTQDNPNAERTRVYIHYPCGIRIHDRSALAAEDIARPVLTYRGNFTLNFNLSWFYILFYVRLVSTKSHADNIVMCFSRMIIHIMKIAGFNRYLFKATYQNIKMKIVFLENQYEVYATIYIPFGFTKKLQNNYNANNKTN